MRLLQFRPEDRMTLQEARNHPWLHAQATAAGLYASERGSGGDNLDRDASMSTVVTNDAMAVDESSNDVSPPLSQVITIPGAYPPSGSQPTRVTRRAVVLMERQESGAGLPEASWQLVGSEDAVIKEDGPADVLTPAPPRGAKRGRLRSIPEDRDAVEPLQDSPANARNRKRIAESVAVVRGRGARRVVRGRAAAAAAPARGRIAKEELVPDAEEEEEDEEIDLDNHPRRSSRLANSSPLKVTRRA